MLVTLVAALMVGLALTVAIHLVICPAATWEELLFLMATWPLFLFIYSFKAIQGMWELITKGHID